MGKVGLLAFAGMALLVGSTAVAGSPDPRQASCARAVSTAEAGRHLLVFEGIVVDRWTEFVKYRGLVRPLHNYQFHVVRRWDRLDAPHEYLTQGRYDWGEYPTYQVGERYLVFANSHDSPPHTFAPPCSPGAAGEEVPALAARLGPPRRIYVAPPQLDASEWLVRRARMYGQFIHWAIRDGF